MEKIVENQYASLFKASPQMLWTTWKPETEDMDDQEFEDFFLEIVQIIQTYQFKEWLGDTRLFRKIVALKQQTWVAETLNPLLTQAGLRKMAIILPQELIANLSVQQSVEEMEIVQTVRQFSTRYFDKIEDAKIWLTT